MRFILFLITTLSIAADFSTSVGDAYQYLISNITTDQAGNTYIVGSRGVSGMLTSISTIDIPPVFSMTTSIIYTNTDVFVSKLDPSGKLLFTDTFAGKRYDRGNAIAVDSSGNIYIAGATTSPDFPISNALQKQASPSSTGFIIKLSNDGASILYSTYFGGVLGSTSISSLATDAKGNLFLTGTTTSTDFPHTPGMPFGPNPLVQANAGVFIASISPAGDKILYSGALIAGPIPIPGGSSSPSSAGVAVDPAGNAYFAGNLGGGTALPTTPGVLAPTGSFTGFGAKVNASGTGLSYLTYLPSFASAIAVDTAGEAYLAGYGLNAPPGAPPSGYVAKLNPTASAIVWTNNLTGQAAPVNAIALDAGGNLWVTGAATTSFPNANGWTTGQEFVAALNNSGTAFTYSALYPYGAVAQSVAIDPSGLVHVAGSNGFVSAIAPSGTAAMKILGFQNAFGEDLTARISPAEVISIYGPGIGPSAAATASPVNGFYPKTLAGVQVTINGQTMPLLYVSANQINAIFPATAAANAAATIRVTNGTAVSPDYPVWILSSAPVAYPTVLNQDATVNSRANPAKSGSVVSFYATGWQSDFSPLADGQVATAAKDVCAGTCQVTALGPGVSGSTVLYGGTAPGIVAGVSQINMRVGTVSPLFAPDPFVFSVHGSSSVIQIVWAAP